MNRQFCRVFLILSLAILVICLPAQAAHAGQSGPSLSIPSQGVQGNISSGLSVTNSQVSVEKAPGIDTGTSVSSQSLVQAGPDVMTSGKTEDRPSITDKSTQTMAVNTKAGSSPSSGPSGDSSGRSDPSPDARADAAGGTGSSQGTEGQECSRNSRYPGTIQENREDWLV